MTLSETFKHTFVILTSRIIRDLTEKSCNMNGTCVNTNVLLGV